MVGPLKPRMVLRWFKNSLLSLLGSFRVLLEMSVGCKPLFSLSGNKRLNMNSLSFNSSVNFGD